MIRLLVVTLTILTPEAVFAFDQEAVRQHCDAEWGNDFQMVRYCRDQQESAGRSVDRFAEEAERNDTKATILDGCRRDWDQDYEMIEYCIGQQQEAFETLQSSAADVPTDISRTILAGCESEWSTDFEMVAYCVGQQTSAWRSLQ